MVTGAHRAAGGLRRFVRDYAWVIVAVALAVIVALCSLRFTSGIAPVWKAGAPAPSTSLVADLTAAPIVAPMISASTAPLTPPPDDAGSPSPGGWPGPDGSPTPARASVTQAPAPAHTTAPAPKPRTTTAELGPVSNGELKATIRLYCWQEFGAAEVRPHLGGWECRGPGFQRPVDMDAMCTWRNGPTARAHVTDPTDAYSWRCDRRHDLAEHLSPVTLLHAQPRNPPPSSFPPPLATHAR
ncbi:hypothetical protein [Catenuloplanes indicus]|uniref:Uncharacterized protein n=1 Tax=Catenuloplanes indicus TaxID=137267 RepID=A0AAE3VWW6_9ACTN|nr:hypothetical protein [Catenuloplanes indicus]MDQ0365498.1 hypothetical protein [Catenuloplanes indicus]